MCTFICTFFLGILEGISAGIFISVAFVLRASAYPEIITMGRLPGTVHFKNVLENPECRQIPGIAIVYMGFNLYFANSACFKRAVHEAAMGHKHTSSKPIRFVVLDATAWTTLDMAAINTLSDIHAELLTLHIQLAFANARVSVKEYLQHMKFIEKIGGDQFLFDSIEDAVRAQPGRKVGDDRPRNADTHHSFNAHSHHFNTHTHLRSITLSILTFTPSQYSHSSPSQYSRLLKTHNHPVKMSMAVEMHAMFLDRESVIRNASMSFENVIFSGKTTMF